jgi:Flp pilus assembly protein TadG
MRLLNRRRAVTSVEMAMVSIPVFMMVYGILEYGRYLMVANLAQNAAREGARYASIQRSANQTSAQIATTTTQINTNAQNKMGFFGPGISVTASVYALDPTTFAEAGNWNTATFLNPLKVKITGTYQPVAWKIMGISSTLPIFAQCAIGSEAN